MKATYRNLFFLLLMAGFILAGCSSSRMGGSAKGCGCGAHKGFVGY